MYHRLKCMKMYLVHRWKTCNIVTMRMLEKSSTSIKILLAFIEIKKLILSVWNKKNLEINATKNVDLGWNAEYFKNFEFFLSLST